MQQSACLVVKLVTVYNYGFLFNCATVGKDRLNDGTDIELSYVGWCLKFVFSWANVAQIEVICSVTGIYLSKVLTCMIFFQYEQNMIFIKEADTFGHIVVLTM